MEAKEYAAFISFADPDRTLVEYIVKLFNDLDLQVYFAPADLPSRGSVKWREEILKAIKSSACIIPIMTQNSINRPWVLYEMGAADVLELPIYKARTSSVSTAQLQNMPGNDTYVYNLSDESNIRDLVLNVLEKFKDSTHIPIASKFISQNVNARQIRALSIKRKVFIGGSAPINREKLDALSKLYNKLEGDELLRKIVCDITTSLLNNGFFVSSCPDVSAVGRTVLESSIKWCEEHGKELLNVYSPQGQLTFPEGQSEEALIKALKHGFIHSRKEYLKDFEFLLIIGGNNRTELECKAARELGSIKIVPISCIGGTALKIAKDNSFKKNLHQICNDNWSEKSLFELINIMK